MAGELEIGSNVDEAGLLMTYGAADDPPDIEFGAKADSNLIRLHPPDPCEPPDPCSPALELIASAEIHSFKLHPPDPCTPAPCIPAVAISAVNALNSVTVNKPPPHDSRPAIKLLANNENLIELYYPDADADEGIVQIGSDAATGGFIELHAADSLTLTRVMMGGSTTDTGYVRLFGGGSQTEYKLLELSSHTDLGGSVTFFDPENIDGRELLSIGHNAEAGLRAFSGIGIYGFNPQPEPPGHIAFEMTSDGPGGRLALYDTEDASAVLSGGSCLLTGPDTAAQVQANANTEMAEVAVVRQLADANSEVTMQVDDTRAELILSKSEVSAAPAIALRVDSDGGKIGINTNTPGEELYVVGDITATGAITEISSVKYKANISEIENALDRVSQLRGVTFDWRQSDYPEMDFSEDKQIGVVAEEVEGVIPELVHVGENGEISVDYSKLTAVLIEAVKEQQQQIDALTRRLEELEQAGSARR
jgi:hypothetical protein